MVAVREDIRAAEARRVAAAAVQPLVASVARAVGVMHRGEPAAVAVRGRAARQQRAADRREESGAAPALLRRGVPMVARAAATSAGQQAVAPPAEAVEVVEVAPPAGAQPGVAEAAAAPRMP